MPILIVTYFNLNDSGVYFLSLKLLGTPLFLISSSISQVYYQKSSEMFYTSKENLFTLTKKIVLTNIVIMIIFIILINTIGIYFLELLFDKNWDDLRLYTLILSFLILARSSFNPISNIIIVLNKNHVSLIFNSYLLFVNLAAILFGYLSNSLINTIIFLSIFGGLGYIALLIYFMKRLKELKS
jgi:O-antigen/teichoic acid export membrane protein